MLTLRNKKIFFNKIVQILQTSDSVSIELDAEWVKGKNFERAATILTGLSATLATLLESLEIEIANDSDQERMNREFQSLFEAEQNRKPHLIQPDESQCDDANEEDQGPPLELGL